MPDLDPAVLVLHQICLEYGLDDQQRLILRPGSDEQALCVVYRYAGGGRLFFRRDLPLALQDQLRQLEPAQAYADPARLDALLGLPVPPWREVFQASVFTHCPAPAEYPLVENDGQAYVIYPSAVPMSLDVPFLQPSQPVAVAWSVRQDNQAAELAVETHPAFRRRGYARQVAAAWAAARIRQGQVAFYSHKAANLPSLALRRSLGAVPFADSLAWEEPA